MHLRHTLLIVTALVATPDLRADVLYATSGPVNPNLLTVDPATGVTLSSVPITNEEALFGGLTWTGSQLLTIDGYNDALSDRTFGIDPMTGVGTVLGPTTFNWNFRCVERDPTTGKVYALTDNRLYTLDLGTGNATLLFNLSGTSLSQATSFAIDGTGRGFVTDTGGQDLFELDLATGTMTHLGSLAVAASGWFQDLAFDSTDQLWGVYQTGGLYRIDVVAVTATLAAPVGSFAGIAFVDTCTVTTYCAAKVNSLGCTPAIGTQGTPSVVATSGFVVQCAQVRNAKPGLLFYVVNGAQVSVPFQGGTLCVGPTNIRRTPARSAGGSPPPANDCSGVFSIDMNAFAAGLGGGTPAPALGQVGNLIQVQWWGRDQGFPAPNNTTLSDAVEYETCP